ncbi:MAG TPA: hypothetical protein VLS89_10270, partial [Candidatus Nanopelagicales bacterium]|nr:hypothetical protein [Candidatus Nanopelagicales bacterium]
MRRALLGSAALLLLPVLTGCVNEGLSLDGVSTFQVEVTSVNGMPLPSPDLPLPANLGQTDEVWEFVIAARDGSGDPLPFEGMVRLRTEPGSVQAVEGEDASGRNVMVRGGRATGFARITAVYGPARLWVEDLGYLPVADATQAACSNGKNDDPGDDVLVDFPSDPGCAFANDDSEQEGTFAAGVSPAVEYALPRISDIQGRGAETPFRFEGMEVNTAAPQRVVVTRISSDGFYVADLAEEGQGYNYLYAFNFRTPPFMRVCDRVEYLAGTVNEFFGSTQIAFPSFWVSFPVEGEECEVPEPNVIDAGIIANSLEMEKLESGLVRISGYHVAANFGKNKAEPSELDPEVFVFAADRSNCDLNDDGQVDFESPTEGPCSDQCTQNPECSEWTGY